MSSSTYTSYSISAAEQRRLERERQRRLEEERRRKEEERKREEERRRLKAISEEKERVAIANQFRENMLKMQKENALIRLKKIKKLIEDQNLDSKEKSKLIDDVTELEEIVKSAAYKELQQQFRKIKELEKRDLKDISQSKNAHETTKREMENIIKFVNSQLKSLPDDYWLICSRELQQIQQTVSDIDREKSNNFTYFYQSLKAVQQNLLQLLETIESRRKTWYENLENQYRLMDEFILKLEIVHESAIIEDQQKSAKTIIAAIESLKLQKDLNIIESSFADLQRQGQLLFDEFENIAKRHDERNFIFNTLQDTLKEMGYEVIIFPDSPEPKPSAPKFTYFKTPTREVVKIGLGLDNSIYSEFAHIVEDTDSAIEQISRETLISKCQNWCNDYNELLQRLKEQGIEINEKWRTLPEEGKFEEIVVPSSSIVAEEEKQLQRRRKEQPKRRSL